MAIEELLNDPDWDKPFFKRLPSNDTGAAPGHQGGMVVPKDLRQYFPGLVGRTSAKSPTIDRRIWADLFDGERFVARVNTRYQYQTWGGARSPESRLTDNLSPLRNIARPDDVLVIQRSLLLLDLYRLILVRKDTGAYAAINAMAGTARWGILGRDAPVTERDFEEAQDNETELEAKPFSLFELDASTSISRVTRISRSIVFKQRVSELYGNSCSICKSGLRVPDGGYEIEAAHIVPRSLRGADDARNGVGLCRQHHWAFDRGLFGVSAMRQIVVPTRASILSENQSLTHYHGKAINEAKVPALQASAEAFAWHMDNVVLK
jgi:putative restriction endonuclease